MEGFLKGLFWGANKKGIHIIIICVLGAGIYLNSLSGVFLLDDTALITDNTHIKHWKYFPKLFTEDIGKGSGNVYGYYRPLLMFSLMVDYTLWGLDVKGYHFTAILFHLSVAVSIYWLMLLLFRDPFLSFLTGIMFVSHPIHNSDVAYVTGRADSMALVFMILALIFYIKYVDSQKIKSFCLMVTAYAAALLSKEMSLIFPGLIILYHCSFKKQFRLKPFLTSVIMAFGYLVIKVSLVHTWIPYASYLATWYKRLAGFLVAFTNYIILLFFPFNLHMGYHPRMSFSPGEPKAILGLIMVCVLIWIAWRERNKKGIFFFAIGWFFITLVPVSNIIYPASSYMAERYMYLPSIGFFLIVASLIRTASQHPKFRTGAYSLTVILVAFYSGLTIKQNTYWHDATRFYERTIKYAYDNETYHHNLGLEYQKAGRIDEAVRMYEKALDLNPEYARSYNNLGNIYKSEGKIEKAIEYYKKAVKFAPGYVAHYDNLGNAYRITGQNEIAETYFRKAIGINPDYERTYNSLGILYAGIGKAEEALAFYEKALRINSGYVDAYNNLGLLCADIERNKEAAQFYKIAIEIDPAYVNAYNNLGVLYDGTGQKKQAEEWYKKALLIKKDYAPSYNNLAVLYFYDKKYDLAVRYCDRAIELGQEIDPEFLKLLAGHR